MNKLAQIIAILFILGYWASPVDIVPDIPVVGWSDDIGIALALAWASGMFEDEKTYKVIDEK